MIKVQATISGYSGNACCLMSVYKPETRVLAFGVGKPFSPERSEGCVVVTNIPDIARDTLFTSADLHDAITAFQALRAGVAVDGKSSRLAYAAAAARANPEASIERDGIDASGPKFRIAADITCVQISALASCLYATRATAINSAIDMAEQLHQLALGTILTI